MHLAIKLSYRSPRTGQRIVTRHTANLGNKSASAAVEAYQRRYQTLAELSAPPSAAWTVAGDLVGALVAVARL